MRSLVRSITRVALLACALGLVTAQEASRRPASRLKPAAIQEVLDSHNKVRLQRGIPPLRWSSSLAALAQEWAAHLSSIGELEHDRSRRVGQNLFSSSQDGMPPSFVVGQWAAESKDYDERRFKCSPGAVCGHFTQIIWKDTKEVGCGVARGERGEFWVCYYAPPGNFVGDTPY